MVSRLLFPIELEGAPAYRLLHRVHRVRLGVATLFLGLVWFLPAPTGVRVALFGFIALAYLPWSAILLRLGKHTSPTVVFALAIGDLAILFAIQTTAPSTRLVAMFGYIGIVLFHAQLNGRNFGLVVSTIAFASTAVSGVLVPSEASSAFTVGMFVAILFAVVIVADELTSAHRDATIRLQRLYASLEQVSSSADVHDVLSAVTSEAAEALAADGCVVLLRQDDSLVHYGSSDPGVNEFFAELRRGAFASSDRSALPAVRVITTGKPLLIEDVSTYSDCPAWREAAHSMGFESAYCAPVRGPSDPAGALIIWFTRRRRLEDRERDLIGAYADQASVALGRAQAFEREREAVVKLRELDELKSDLLSNVSHELRTPLTTITGFLETLLERGEAIPPELRYDLLRRSAAASDNLAKRIDQLLDFARVESGRVRIQLESIELERLVRDLMARLERQLRRHRLDVDIEPGLCVLADVSATGHVLENYLTNAAKFSPTGTTILISATVSTAPGQVRIEVRDQGTGIPAGEAERVFDRFYRCGRGDRVQHGGTGTGIGLAVAKQYAEAQGGRVYVTSTPGDGATFGLLVPRAHPATRPLQTSTA